MKSSIKKLKNCKSIVEIKIPPEKVREAFDMAYDNIKKYASIPGFRVGKVPRDLLEINYGKAANEEVMKELIPEGYKSILELYKLDPIGYPDISDIKLDSKDGLSYTISVETKPVFTLKNYKGLKLKKKSSDVKEEDIQKNLEYLREVNAQKAPKKDSEEKDKVLPELDDEFAKDLGLESLEKLKDVIRKNLKEKFERDSEIDLEMQVINQLVDGIDFEIPEALLNSEKERLLKDAGNRIAYIKALQEKAAPDKKFELSDSDKKELEQNTCKQAERQVKAFFILDKIAQSEKIYIEKDELDKRIEEMAGQYKKTKDEVRAHLEKNHMLDEMAVNIRNAKVMKYLLDQAKTTS